MSRYGGQVPARRPPAPLDKPLLILADPSILRQFAARPKVAAGRLEMEQMGMLELVKKEPGVALMGVLLAALLLFGTLDLMGVIHMH